MNIAIPVWLLWVFGIAAGLVLLGLAALGVLFVLFFKGFRMWGG